MVLCSTALTVYFASHSIGTVVVTTLACSLLLQLAYFGSVLVLIWRSGCDTELAKGLSISIVARKLDTSRQTMMR
ncbi:exopolysaccharide production repressor protein [Mesorhizobium sp. M0208]|uniref:exopolysaccharide production repressor protein n=1 Tax=Mesorhizobium sp. M0208 TaxID=2956916 RepID=UPI003336D452